MSEYGDACAAIVLDLACGYRTDPDGVASVIGALGPEERKRLLDALVAAGALADEEADRLWSEADHDDRELREVCAATLLHEDGCQAAEVAGQPVGEALT